MSFYTDLVTKIKEYTKFTVNGYSIKIPYCLGAKNTPDEILDFINTKISSTSSQSFIQSQMDKYKGTTSSPGSTSVDCSGFVYYVLNEATDGAVRDYFEEKIGGNLPYSTGIWSGNLTSTSYGDKIIHPKDLHAGCTIAWDAHVLVVSGVTKNSSGTVTKVWYAHATGPVHSGYIKIGDEDGTLGDDQNSNIWVDDYYSNSTCQSRYMHCLLLDPVADFI